LRSIPTPVIGLYGVPPHFRPGESLRAYGDSIHLNRVVLSIALEIARIPLRQLSVNAKREIEVVKSVGGPAPAPVDPGGQSILSATDPKLVTMMHLLLGGEGAWNLDRRIKAARKRARPLFERRARRFARKVRKALRRDHAPPAPVAQA
jgi:hypothetical protein